MAHVCITGFGGYVSLAQTPPRSGVSRNGLCWGVTPVSICLALPGESLVGAFLSFNKSLWFKHWRFGQTPVLRHTLHFDSVQCWFSLIAPFRLKVSIELMHLCLVFCDYGWLSPVITSSNPVVHTMNCYGQFMVCLCSSCARVCVICVFVFVSALRCLIRMTVCVCVQSLFTVSTGSHGHFWYLKIRFKWGLPSGHWGNRVLGIYR